MIPALSHVSAMAPYAVTDLRVPAGVPLLSLSQNESLRAPSPKAIAAAAQALEHSALYPQSDWSALRMALARVHEVPAETILCGNGSLDLIACLMRAYADRDNAVLAPAHAYPYFRTAAEMAGGRFDTAPEANLTADVDALLDAVRPDTRVLCIANPGNPTGSRIANSELRRLRQGLRDDILLVIDEAYGEFADHLDDPVFDMAARGGSVVLRTLSKAYGLAGLRAGWGVFPPDVAAQVCKVMNPSNISAPALAAAVAAVEDQPYMRATCTMTATLRDGFSARLQKAGLDMVASHTNFVLIRFASPRAVADADAALRAHGVILRPQGGAGLPDCLRATVGDAAAMDLAAGVLEDWVRGDRS